MSVNTSDLRRLFTLADNGELYAAEYHCTDKLRSNRDAVFRVLHVRWYRDNRSETEPALEDQRDHIARGPTGNQIDTIVFVHVRFDSDRRHRVCALRTRGSMVEHYSRTTSERLQTLYTLYFVHGRYR